MHVWDGSWFRSYGFDLRIGVCLNPCPHSFVVLTRFITIWGRASLCNWLRRVGYIRVGVSTCYTLAVKGFDLLFFQVSPFLFIVHWYPKKFVHCHAFAVGFLVAQRGFFAKFECTRFLGTVSGWLQSISGALDRSRFSGLPCQHPIESVRLTGHSSQQGLWIAPGFYPDVTRVGRKWRTLSFFCEALLSTKDWKVSFLFARMWWERQCVSCRCCASVSLCLQTAVPYPAN